MTELRKRSRLFGVVVVGGSTADTPDAINVVAVEILAETAMSVIGT
jgi:selenophosphate synthetase-related protein